MVASSPATATQAGSKFEKGGNAIDAVIAAAVLTVVEPGNGLGSDANAIIFDGKKKSKPLMERVIRRRVGLQKRFSLMKKMPLFLGFCYSSWRGKIMVAFIKAFWPDVFFPIFLKVQFIMLLTVIPSVVK